MSSHLSAAQIHRRLDHPVIDSDGHMIEFLPDIRERVKALAGSGARDAFDAFLFSSAALRGLAADEKRSLGLFRIPWWALPTRNTLDRATAMFPRLFYERLEELGIDFAVLYPTFGLFALGIDDDDLRSATVRAVNDAAAEAYQPLADRLTPVAIIPMHNPDEAIATLDHAVGELGFKAALFAGHVYRPLPGDGVPRGARWVDVFDTDSPYDYTPVWQRCDELGINPTFHSSAMGWDGRASLSSYVQNHLGNFAAAGDATCRSLLLSGVPRRFPNLRFAFLEGGVAWGCDLYAGLLGHWEKRNRQYIGHYDPSAIDSVELRRLLEKYGTEAQRRRADELGESADVLSDPDEESEAIDEFRHSGIERAEDIRDVFASQLFFGCEADDPMNALAFRSDLLPFGTRLQAIFGSDIGHWDVPDVRQVLVEAYELTEKGHLSPADFRAFVFDNPVAFWAHNNRRFFEGTAIAAAVASSSSE